MMFVFQCLLKVYLLLSVIYTISNLPQNVDYHLKHSQESKLKILGSIVLSFTLSMIFGGVSLTQKIFRGVQQKVRMMYAWYQIAKTAKHLTKNLHDTLDNEEEKS